MVELVGNINFINNNFECHINSFIMLILILNQKKYELILKNIY